MAGVGGGLSIQNGATTTFVSGNGAPSYWGGGPIGVIVSSAGNAGTANGSGGSGAGANATTSRAGGNGASGIVVVVEYI
jgi:hypothetical protein